MRKPSTPARFVSFAPSFLPALTAALALVACTTPAEPPNTPPAPVATVVVAEPTPVATAVPSSEPVAEATPGPVATATAETPPPATAIAHGDLVESPGDPRLDPAAAFIKAGQHLKARLALTKVMPDLDKTATLDARMAAHALLGRACHSLADAKCAGAQYETVRALWKDPVAAGKALDAVGGDDKEKTARLGRALKAAGEAMFNAAEEKRIAAEQERYPLYKGNGSREDVLKHVNTKIPPWIKARRARNEEAEKAYVAVLGLQPAPPPQWVVASGARVGQMWGRFAAEFRAAPLPAEWKKSGPHPQIKGLTWEELRHNYYEAIDSAAAPILAQARAAFEKCQTTAQKYAVQDEFSRVCDAWLAKTPKSPSP